MFHVDQVLALVAYQLSIAGGVAVLVPCLRCRIKVLRYLKDNRPFRGYIGGYVREVHVVE